MIHPCRKLGRHVLVLAPDLNPQAGGIQRLSCEWIAALNAIGVTTRTLSLPARNQGRLRSLVFHSAKILFGLRAMIAAVHRPQLVLCMHVGLLPVGSACASLCKAKLGVLLHGVESWKQPRFGSFEFYSKLPSVDFWVACSNITKERSKSWRPAHARCEVVHPPADVSRFSPGAKSPRLLKSLEIPSGAKVILTVARLSAAERYKGHDVLIDILPALIREYGGPLRYLVVGTGDDLARLKERVQQSGLDEIVRFLGHVSDEELPEIYRVSDVFAMPSSGEGFGIVYLEALASGCGVVAGCGDAGREALLGGKLGWLVDPNNRSSVLSGLKAALQAEPDARKSRVAIKVFGVDRFRQRINSIINPMLA